MGKNKKKITAKLPKAVKINKTKTIKTAQPVKNTKTVTVKYTSKKTGLTTTYTYERKPKRDVVSQKLLTKQGEFTKKAQSLLSTIEDVEEREFIKRKVRQFSAEIKAGEREKRAHTLPEFKAMFIGNRIQIYFDNMGISVFDVVADLKMQGELDVDVAWLLTPAHWNFKQANNTPELTLPSGKHALIEFTYHEGFYIVLN